MKETQEPKYNITAIDPEARLVNRVTGEIIPDEEPVFIFRARDTHALAALVHYAELVKDGHHRQVIYKRAADFMRFRQQYPERMKEPDSCELGERK